MKRTISNDILDEYPLPITELDMLRTYNMTVSSIAVVDNIRKVGTFRGNCAGLPCQLRVLEPGLSVGRMSHWYRNENTQTT